ncbi:phage tail protein [Actinophytocola sediminis]
MSLTIGELVGYLELDDKNWTRGNQRARDDLRQFRADIDEFSSRAASRFLSTANSLSNIPVAISALSGSASIFGQMAGAVGLIPAAGAGAVAMIAALKLGMEGFSDALSSTDPAALEELSPAARETAVAVRDMRDEWDAMQDSVQERLFADTADIVSDLGGKYIPVLERGLGDIAGQFNAGARSAGAFLGEARQVATVDDILGGTRDVAGELAGTLRPLASILLDTAAVGMEFLPGLTGGLTDAAEGAAEFVRNARDTGQLHEWISTGLSTIGDLIDVFQNLGRIVGAVFSAFDTEGASFLQTLEEITGKVADFLESVEGQQALAALAGALSAVSDVVTDVLLVALEQLAPVIVALAPGFAQFAQIVGGTLVSGLQVLGPLLLGLATFISANVTWLGPLAIALYAGVQALGAVTTAVRILNAVTALNPWVLIIAATIALAVLIVTHWDQITAAIGAAWDWLVTKAGEVWGWIDRNIVEHISNAADWVGDRISDILDFFGWLASLPGKIAAWFGSVRDAAIRKLGELVSWVASLPGKILGALGDLGRLLWDAGVNIIRGLLDGLASMASAVIDWFTGLIGDAVDSVLSVLGISSPSKVFRQIGVWSGEGLVQGLKSMVDPVTGAAAALADAAVPSPALAGAGAPDMFGAAGGMAGAGAAGGGRAPLHIEHYHAPQDADPAEQAEAWDWLSRGGG